MADKKVVVQKIKPYPIAITIDMGAQKVSCEILKLAPKGFIMDTKAALLKVGNEHMVTFEIPVSREVINGRCKVIKTYDHRVGSAPAKRLAEMHFLGINGAAEISIQKFVSAIGQKDS